MPSARDIVIKPAPPDHPIFENPVTIASGLVPGKNSGEPEPEAAEEAEPEQPDIVMVLRCGHAKYGDDPEL